MSVSANAELCDFCGKGTIIKRSDEITFRQQTERGPISCKVTIPIGICDRCGMRTWDDAADPIIEEAVRREIDKLR